MSNVVDLTSRRRKESDKGTGGNETVPSKPSRPRVDKDTYALWMFSQDVDALVRHAVAAKGLPVEEVAAILAHRLGALAAASERPEALTAFCKTLLDRLTSGGDGSFAGQPTPPASVASGPVHAARPDDGNQASRGALNEAREEADEEAPGRDEPDEGPGRAG